MHHLLYSLFLICNTEYNLIFEIDSAIIVHNKTKSITNPTGIMKMLSINYKKSYNFKKNQIIFKNMEELIIDTSIYNFNNDIYRIAIFKDGIMKISDGCEFYRAKVRNNKIGLKVDGKHVNLQYQISNKGLNIHYKEQYPVFENEIYLYFHRVDMVIDKQNCEKKNNLRLLPKEK